MARRKKEDLLSYPYTPEKQLEHPSGWCMTSDHAGCRYQFNHGKCGCKCHTEKMKEEIVSIADSNDPRPWKVEA